MSIFDKLKTKVENYQEQRQQQKDQEQARRDNIASGNLTPIATAYNLAPDENAYISYKFRRMAMVEKTVMNTKKSGASVIGRAVVGGVLLGPLGALGGATTANSKTTEKTTEAIECIDAGEMLLTNKRFLCIGQKAIISIPYDTVIDLKFKSIALIGNSITIKYPEMLPHESYHISGTDADISELYYQGIRQL